MHLAITGASGLIGSALASYLKSKGHQVSRFTRLSSNGSGDIFWNPSRGQLDAERLEGVEGVVHLAGENVAARRWTNRQKARIRASRIEGTWLLCEGLSRLKKPPRVLVSASAIGYYGDRGEETLTESSPPGKGFLAQVCQEWEEATEAAQKRGMRVVHLRIGIVLSPKGGALAKMLTPFRLGIGGPIGNGRQVMSWIALDDLIEVIHFALTNDSLSGAVNAVAPNPLTNAQFSKVLGRVLGRPAFFPLPGFAIRFIFGQLGQELLLSGARVKPGRLSQAGFHFKYSELEAALRHLLGG